MNEYNLTLLELDEFQEYEREKCRNIYRVKDGKLEFKCGDKKYQLSSYACYPNPEQFRKLVPKPESVSG